MYGDTMTGLMVIMVVNNQNLLHSSRVRDEICEVVKQNM